MIVKVDRSREEGATLIDIYLATYHKKNAVVRFYGVDGEVFDAKIDCQTLTSTRSDGMDEVPGLLVEKLNGQSWEVSEHDFYQYEILE